MEKKYYIFEMNGIILNIIAVIILFIMFVFTLFINPEFLVEANFDYILLFMIPYFILHELIHGLSYQICGANSKYITYGAHLEKGILCCLCKQNVTKKNILISLLSPFIIIGIITYVLGILISNDTLILLSIMNISGSAGDLMMFLGLSKLKDFEYSEYDNPMAFGLYSKQDLSKTKLFGLNYIGKKEKLEKNDLKKITTSKVSLVILTVFVLIGIINIFI